MLLAVVAMAMMPSTMMAASLNEAAPMSVVKAGNISGTLDVQWEAILTLSLISVI